MQVGEHVPLHHSAERQAGIRLGELPPFCIKQAHACDAASQVVSAQQQLSCHMSQHFDHTCLHVARCCQADLDASVQTESAAEVGVRCCRQQPDGVQASVPGDKLLWMGKLEATPLGT